MDSKKVAITILAISFRACILALAVILTVLFSGKAYQFGVSIFDEKSVAASTGQLARNVTVTIPEGVSDMDLAKLMEENGLTTSRYLFWAQLKLSDHYVDSKSDPVLPGTYELNTGMTASEILSLTSVKPEPEEEETAAQTTEKETAEDTSEAETTTAGEQHE